MTKDIYNGVIDSYTIDKYTSGIIHLVIHTSKKWINYDRDCNHSYKLDWEEDDDYYMFRIPKEELTIPSNYICTHTQNKDEIHYFWTPIELCTNKKKIKEKLEKSR